MRSGLPTAAAGLSAVHAANYIVVGPNDDSFTATWANVMLHGRWWTLVTSQLHHTSFGHMLGCGATLVASAVLLQGRMRPMGYLGCVLASGTSGAAASVVHSVLAHAPSDALPILYGGPPRRAARGASRHRSPL